jgi:gluconolactonase
VKDTGVLYYAKADGSLIREAVFPCFSPNGIGLSRDQKRLYGVDSAAGRVWMWELDGPGSIARKRGAPMGATLVGGLGGYQLFDSLAIDGAGNVCVGTIGTPSGISVFSPERGFLEQIELPDLFVTNLCFGGPELKTAYVTLSSTGRVVALDWPRPGLPLAWLDYRPG